MNREQVSEVQDSFKGCSAEEILKKISAILDPESIALASSFSIEDQVLTDMIMKVCPDIQIFTLDTGRLFQETYDVMEKTFLKYNKEIEVLFPDREAVESMVREHGPNLFYYSIENRKLCCRIRKVDLLKGKLATLDAWICGLRSEQSVTRANIDKIEWDEGNGLAKLNPLADWSEDDVWQYIKENNLPYNELHEKGFPSIGCAPCTRAVKEGEDIRAGRWWWEHPDLKECGLHVKAAAQ